MVTDLDIRRRCQCPGARYGLWSDTTEPGERLARLRALRALVRVFAGPAEAGVDAALSVAEIDPDLRVLTKKKSNYSAIGDEITLRWENGAFRALNAPGPDAVDRMDQASKATGCQEAFLAALAKLETEDRKVTSKSRAGNYAPNEMTRIPMMQAWRKRQISRNP